MLLICLFTVNSPIPSNLKSEAKKAAKILREFTEISNRQGPDKLIPGKRYLSITFVFSGFILYHKIKHQQTNKPLFFPPKMVINE